MAMGRPGWRNGEINLFRLTTNRKSWYIEWITGRRVSATATMRAWILRVRVKRRRERREADVQGGCTTAHVIWGRRIRASVFAKLLGVNRIVHNRDAVPAAHMSHKKQTLSQTRQDQMDGCTFLKATHSSGTGSFCSFVFANSLALCLSLSLQPTLSSFKAYYRASITDITVFDIVPLPCGQKPDGIVESTSLHCRLGPAAKLIVLYVNVLHAKAPRTDNLYTYETRRMSPDWNPPWRRQGLASAFELSV